MLHWSLEEAFGDLLVSWREHHRRQCLGDRISVTRLGNAASCGVYDLTHHSR